MRGRCLATRRAVVPDSVQAMMTEAPTQSTSQSFIVADLPGTNDWCTSSVAAYMNAAAKATHAALRLTVLPASDPNARYIRAASPAYSIKCTISAKFATFSADGGVGGRENDESIKIADA